MSAEDTLKAGGKKINDAGWGRCSGLAGYNCSDAPA